jgi:3-hydroxyisobutyrate dehydrogenase
MTSVGFVGLGSQGGPMARRIIETGYQTTLWARRAESIEPFADLEFSIATTLPELGARSDLLCVCVVDDAGVNEILRGSEGALGSMQDGSIVVIHSTVHPATCIQLQQDYPRIRFLDAPVSGGGHKAAAQELLVMVGGPIETVDQCLPIIRTFGDPVLHVGPLGAGQQVKVLNNTVFTAHLALAAEVFELARARQLDLQAVASILAHGSGRSYAAEIVGRGSFNLDGLAQAAGTLLAKDVGIFAGYDGLSGSQLLQTADAALARMQLERPAREGEQ